MPELPPPPSPPTSAASLVAGAIAGLAARVRGHRAAAVWSSLPPRRRALAVAGVVVAAALVVVAAGAAPASRRAGRAADRPELFLPRAATGAAERGEAGGVAAADLGANGTDGRPAGDASVAVHAAGAVARPGVHRLPAGSRIVDLVAAAGGATADADLDAVNLAAPLEDGQRVYVPRRGEPPPAGGDPAGAEAAGGRAGDSPVNLNTATLADLVALPGVGPATAQAILDHRREHGRFRSVDELLEVRGIGEARLAALRKRVRV